MEEELNTNIPDSATTTEAEVESKSTEPFKSFATEEEFKKAIQSERSKAKGEILKELGVSSVNDFNTLKSKYEDAIKDKIVSRVEEYAKEKGYNYLTIDGVKVLYDDGFALVRASNTGPNITARFEAKTEERLKIIEKEFIDLLNQLLNK